MHTTTETTAAVISAIRLWEMSYVSLFKSRSSYFLLKSLHQLTGHISFLVILGQEKASFDLTKHECWIRCLTCGTYIFNIILNILC